MNARPRVPKPKVHRMTLRLTDEQWEAVRGLAAIRRAMFPDLRPRPTASSLLDTMSFAEIVTEYHRLSRVFNSHVGKAKRDRRPQPALA